MKIAILTMFGELNTTYSLVNVVAEQVRMMLDASVPVTILVCEQFNDDSKFGIFLDSRIEWRKIVNSIDSHQIEWHDYDETTDTVHETFFKESSIIAEDLAKNLADIDVCILHDILYQGWHLVHNVALREAQIKIPNVKFLSFSHSAPLNYSPNSKWPFKARYMPMPNTTFVSLTYAGISPLAKQYQVPEGSCRIVYNTLDILQDKSDDVKNLMNYIDILSPDVLIVYPGRLTSAKSFDKVSAFAGAIKKFGEKTVKVVFCDFPSEDTDSSLYKQAIRMNGIVFGLSYDDLIFTSDCGYPNGFPRTSVLELFSLSNVFVLPSYSEAFPLVALEAASKGNIIILNQAVPALDEIGRQINAYFMRWNALNYGFQTTETYYPSEEEYYAEHIENILTMLREDRSIYAKTLVRQRYNPKWVWKNQFVPILGI